jgi:hypothetical protein
MKTGVTQQPLILVKNPVFLPQRATPKKLTQKVV